MTCRHKIRSTTKRGFTLLEVMTAAVILALAVGAISSISARATRRFKKCRQYELAWQVMDMRLTEISTVGPSEFLEQDQLQGTVPMSPAPGAPVCHWSAEITDDDLDGIYDVKMTVQWGPNKSITAETKLYDDKTSFDI